MDNNEIGRIFAKGTDLLFDLLSQSNFTVVTGFISTGDVDADRERNHSLLSIIKGLELTAYSLVGHWESIPERKIIGENEDSFVIINPPEMDPESFFNKSSEIIKEASLNAFIYSNDSGIYKVNADGSEEKLNSVFSTDNLAAAYKKLRGIMNASFVFDGTAQPVNVINQLIFKSMGLNWFKE